ncbi:MAG: hypothetical protein ACOYT4_05460 [Nanoarchaeota archaeon]
MQQQNNQNHKSTAYKPKAYVGFMLVGLLILSITPFALSDPINANLAPEIEITNFEPNAKICTEGILYDLDGAKNNNLILRENKYAFNGEQINWKILVWDKNGIKDINNVTLTVKNSNNEVLNKLCTEVKYLSNGENIKNSCESFQQDNFPSSFDNSTMKVYECKLNIKSVNGAGKHFMFISASDIKDANSVIYENWYLNPNISLDIKGNLNFDQITPGKDVYSNPVLIKNNAENDSGIALNMFISGNDFSDSLNDQAQCPISNKLALENFRYFAVNGNFSTIEDLSYDLANANRNMDDEGFMNIEKSTEFNSSFYDNAEVIQSTEMKGDYYNGNILQPNSEMKLTLKLNVPEPCSGNFDSGAVYVWAEVI